MNNDWDGEERRQRNWLQYAPLLGVIAYLTGMVWFASGVASDVNSNSRRITALEIQQTGVRLAGIDAKLDMIIADRAAEKARQK